ncbi:bombyxin A-2 homolog [Maniola jurtina]|uniref:bombyxin A-2 homolog n=1 Tax=Maniola jurtina TaxID=191418 RepID=UPI001E6863BD|nr:bombyxin A-2 homolog [Maniola jurtina]
MMRPKIKCLSRKCLFTVGLKVCKMNITLVCLMLIVSTGMSHLEERARTYCGRALVYALSISCERAKAEPPMFMPRPWPTTLTQSGSKLHEEEVELVDEVEVEEQEPRSSIVEVCCEKPCFISELLAFCQ